MNCFVYVVYDDSKNKIAEFYDLTDLYVWLLGADEHYYSEFSYFIERRDDRVCEAKE